MADVIQVGVFPVLQRTDDRRYLIERDKRNVDVRSSEGCCLSKDATMVLVEYWRRGVHGVLCLRFRYFWKRWCEGYCPTQGKGFTVFYYGVILYTSRRFWNKVVEAGIFSIGT